MANQITFTITAVDKATEVARRIKASVAGITKPVDDLGKSVKAFGKELGVEKLASGLGKMKNAAIDAGHGVASIVPPLTAITGVATLGGIAALVTGFGKLGVRSQNSATQLGMSVQQLQQWQGAARLAGLSAEDMTSALSGIGDAVESASTNDPEKMAVMKQFHIGVYRQKDGSVDTVRELHDVADAMSHIGNAQERVKLANALQIPASMIPMLIHGSAGLDELAKKAAKVTMTPQQLEAAERYNQSMVEMEFSAENLRNKLGGALAPALERIINAVSNLTDKYGGVIATKIAEYAQKLADWLDRTNWAKVADDVQKFIDRIGGVGTIAAAVAAITFAGPISGVLGLITQLVRLTTVIVPAAAGALGTLGLAGIAAWGALKVAKLAGLPDVNNQQGIDDVKKGDWLAASTHLPAGDFLRAMAARAAGKSDADIAASLGHGANPAAASASAAPPPSPMASSTPPSVLFSQLEKQYGLPSGLLDSVWSVESSRGKNLVGPATSTGEHAMGHFQFLEATARQYGVKDRNSLTDSATGAAKMYADLLRQNGGNLPAALAAYNWGEGNLQRKGIGAAPAETRDYIAKVMAGMGASGVDSTSGAADPALATAGDDASVYTMPGQASTAPQQIALSLEFTGLPSGVRVKAASRAPGVTVAASVGHTSMGRDTI